MRTALGTDKLRAIYDSVAGRYDRLHGILTVWSDERGRRFVVHHAVKPGARVLDAGGGTGSSAILAAQACGPHGRIVVFDLSESMLAIAKRKVASAPYPEVLVLRAGDMAALPFDDATFDAVLSTYSLCPLDDPVAGAMEMWRVLKEGGRMGIVHSTEPANGTARRLARGVEHIAWRFPRVSLGCRPVSVLPALRRAGATVIMEKRFGVPLWPFLAFVVEKRGSACVATVQSERDSRATQNHPPARTQRWTDSVVE